MDSSGSGLRCLLGSTAWSESLRTEVGKASNNAGAGGGVAGSLKSSSPFSFPTWALRSAAPSMLPTTATPVVRFFLAEDASEFNTGLGGMSIGFEDVLVAGIVVALLGILVAMFKGADSTVRSRFRYCSRI